MEEQISDQAAGSAPLQHGEDQTDWEAYCREAYHRAGAPYGPDGRGMYRWMYEIIQELASVTDMREFILRPREERSERLLNS